MNIRSVNKSFFFTDKASVFRYTEVINDDKSTTHKITPVTELSDIPCKLNTKNSDNPIPNEVNTIQAVYTLFIDTLIGITAGDYIRVNSKNKEYYFTAGDPILYEFHQEVALSLKEWA